MYTLCVKRSHKKKTGRAAQGPVYHDERGHPTIKQIISTHINSRRSLGAPRKEKGEVNKYIDF